MRSIPRGGREEGEEGGRIRKEDGDVDSERREKEEKEEGRKDGGGMRVDGNTRKKDEGKHGKRRQEEDLVKKKRETVSHTQRGGGEISSGGLWRRLIERCFKTISSRRGVRPAWLRPSCHGGHEAPSLSGGNYNSLP